MLFFHRRTVLVVAVLLLPAIPVPHRVAPAWPVKLIDQNGIPQGDIAATQTWRHRVYQPDLKAETRRSDSQGRLAFPERIVWGSGWRYLYGIVANFARDGTDATFGPDVWVYAKVNPGFGGSNVYTQGQIPPDTLVLHRYGVCPASTAPASQAGTLVVPGRLPEPLTPGLVEMPVDVAPKR